MAVKVHLKTGEFICSSCSSEVQKDAEKCPDCGEDFDGVQEESEIFLLPTDEENKDETTEVVRIFRMVTGSSVLDVSYIDKIKRDIEDLNAPARFSSILSILKFYAQKYQDINSRFEEMLGKMKKEKKDEILSDLDVLGDMEKERIKILDRIREIQNYYGEFLENYQKILKKKEALLKGRIDEFQKEVERRKIQAKMLVEKEKELLEREHKLRERERAIENELQEIVEKGKTMEEGEISREEWMEQQRKIQEKLYQLREEVVKKSAVSEKEKLTKEVLKILDELLGKLPDEVIEEFARSKDFDLYKKVMEMYGLGGGSGSS